MVALILKEKISQSSIENTLWSIKWDEESLLTPPVPSAVSCCPSPSKGGSTEKERGVTGATKSEEFPIGPPPPPNMTVEQSQEADLNLTDVCDNLSDEWGSGSEGETLSETIGDLSFLFNDKETMTSTKTFSQDLITPKPEGRPKKHRSPASKESQFQRLL